MPFQVDPEPTLIRKQINPRFISTIDLNSNPVRVQLPRSSRLVHPRPSLVAHLTETEPEEIQKPETKDTEDVKKRRKRRKQEQLLNLLN